MTDLKNKAKYYALTIDNFIQMNIDTGQLEVYEALTDAERYRRGKQAVTEIEVSKIAKQNKVNNNMKNKTEQLEDYNTPLSDDDRAEISDYIELLLDCLEGCRNMMVGMKFDININPDIKEALQSKINDIEEVLDNQTT